MKVPVAHSAQAVDPVLAVKRPGAQAAQVLAPDEDEKVPTPQVAHDVWPVWLCAEPGLQL